MVCNGLFYWNFVKKSHIRWSFQRYHIISILSNEKYKKNAARRLSPGSLRSSSLPGPRQDSDSLFIGSQGAKNAYNVLPKWNSNKICDIWDIYRLSTRTKLILNIVLMVLCMFASPPWNMIHVTPIVRRQRKMGGNSCGECLFPFYLVPAAITYSIAVVLPSCDVSFIKMTARGGSSKWIESTRVAHTTRTTGSCIIPKSDLLTTTTPRGKTRGRIVCLCGTRTMITYEYLWMTLEICSLSTSCNC